MASHVLFTQPGHIRFSGSDLKTGPEFETTIGSRKLLQVVNRVDSHTIRPLRRFAANLFSQFEKGSIDFILEQSRIRAGAALADIAAIDKHTIHTSCHQLMREKSATNSSTDHDGVDA